MSETTAQAPTPSKAVLEQFAQEFYEATGTVLGPHRAALAYSYIQGKVDMAVEVVREVLNKGNANFDETMKDAIRHAQHLSAHPQFMKEENPA